MFADGARGFAVCGVCAGQRVREQDLVEKLEGCKEGGLRGWQAKRDAALQEQGVD